MYRNVIDWLASFHRLRSKRNDPIVRYTRRQVIDQQAAYYQCSAADIEALAHPAIQSYAGLEGRAIGWLVMLGKYLDLVHGGAPIHAMRCEDLQGHREASLEWILHRVGLSRSALPSMLRAFANDAQAGTIFARDDGRGNVIKLPDSQQATVRELLSKQETINRADYVLPGTILQD